MTTIYQVSAPSNIALIKYWGKRDAGLQWPANDSLSMTLRQACTETSAHLAEDGIDSIVTRNSGLLNQRLDKAKQHVNFLRQVLSQQTGITPSQIPALKLITHNSFPSDCGIASSASGLAALTIAAIAAWTQSHTWADLARHGFDRHFLASLARRGSGSACRSLFGGYVAWEAGSTPEAQRLRVVSNSASLPLRDLIVIVSTEAKQQSSTQAHTTAWSSPLFAPRLAGLPQRFAQVEQAVQQNNFSALGELIETEALEMHAVMMSSTPAAKYFAASEGERAGTGEIAAWIRKERQRGEFEAYFTIDAGPNLHILCRPADAAFIKARIQASFMQSSSEPLTVLDDETGDGPTLIVNEQSAHFANAIKLPADVEQRVLS